ncbi:MAG: hypothetical protein IJU14_01390 [Clostridia bacterium]|nr:hypothetical protein [Clostridia bacterium]
MANITEELLTIQNAVYGEDMRMAIYSALQKLNENSVAGAMCYISEAVTISTTDEYKLSSNKIAPSSPVNITVQGGAGTSTIVRTDDEDLVDILTGNTVDSTMTDIQITAQDVIAGIKATGTMSIVMKYYNKNCENLLQMINNSSNGVTTVSMVNTVIPVNSSSVVTVSEVE